MVALSRTGVGGGHCICILDHIFLHISYTDIRGNHPSIQYNPWLDWGDCTYCHSYSAF